MVILGAAPLLIAQGLSESMAGRFEITRLGHWRFAEVRDAFGFSLEQFISPTRVQKAGYRQNIPKPETLKKQQICCFSLLKNTT